MFRTNELLIFEKNMLNLGTFIISLQSYRLVEKPQACTGILYVDVINIARNVLHDLKQQPADVLSRA